MSAQKASQCIQKWVAGDYTDDTSDDEHNEINDSASSEDDNVEKEEPAIDDDSDLSHSSDPESEVEDSAQTTADDDVLLSKDGSIRWRKKPLAAPQGRRAAPNVVHKAQSVLTPKEDVSDPRRCMEWFLDKSFFDILQKHTNEEVSRRRQSDHNVHSYYQQDFDVNELQACIGLLILTGVMRSAGESMEMMWSEGYGRPILRATMPLKRFLVFLSCARFDDKTTRKERRSVDKLAPIRQLMDNFVDKCSKTYNTSPYVCVDETLVGFRGKCPFRVYIPSKPDKYGIKVWSLCDSGTNYLFTCQVYVGKQGDSPEVNQGARVVKDLTGKLHGSGQNITTDNFFTSYALGQYLLTKNITLLGTMRKNRRELPSQLLQKKRPMHESLFAFTPDTTLVSYAPKKNRSVVLLSTMHDKPDVDDGEAKKPNMVLDYNATKGSVDAFDQNVGQYTCAKKTRRWPMRLFFFILDAACYNAFVVSTIATDQNTSSTPSHRRRLFLTEGADMLIRPFIDMRSSIPSISHQPSVARAMLSIGVQPNDEDTVNAAKPRGRCQSCPRKKEQKVVHRCPKCSRFVCGKHGVKTTSYTCVKCPLT